jgi:hypothetical protein
MKKTTHELKTTTKRQPKIKPLSPEQLREWLQSWWIKRNGTDHCVLPRRANNPTKGREHIRASQIKRNGTPQCVLP